MIPVISVLAVAVVGGLIWRHSVRSYERDAAPYRAQRERVMAEWTALDPVEDR